MQGFKKECTNCAADLREVFDNAFNEAAALIEITGISNIPVCLRLVQVNRPFKTLFKISSETVTENILKQIPLLADDNLIEKCAKVVETGESFHFDCPKELFDRQYRVCVSKIDQKKVILVLTDITFENEAREISGKHQILFENAQDIILYVLMDGTIAEANRSALEKYGYSKAEILTKKIQDIRHPSTMHLFESQMLQADGAGIFFECLHQRKDGSTFPVEVSAKSTDTTEGRLRIHIIRDITERKNNEEKIMHLANFDALTEIPNRLSLLNQLDNALDYAKRQNQKLSVMLFDVDKFKTINDQLGHAAGDAVLKYVAERAKSVLRKSDIIGRLGGDEFVIVQTGLQDDNDAGVLADKVIHAVREPLPYNDIYLTLSISIGIRIFPDDTDNEKELLRLCDEAMYNAKQTGGGKYKFHQR